MVFLKTIGLFIGAYLAISIGLGIIFGFLIYFISPDPISVDTANVVDWINVFVSAVLSGYVSVRYYFKKSASKKSAKESDGETTRT